MLFFNWLEMAMAANRRSTGDRPWLTSAAIRGKKASNAAGAERYHSSGADRSSLGCLKAPWEGPGSQPSGPRPFNGGAGKGARTVGAIGHARECRKGPREGVPEGTEGGAVERLWDYERWSLVDLPLDVAPEFVIPPLRKDGICAFWDRAFGEPFCSAIYVKDVRQLLVQFLVEVNLDQRIQWEPAKGSRHSLMNISLDRYRVDLTGEANCASFWVNVHATQTLLERSFQDWSVCIHPASSFSVGIKDLITSDCWRYHGREGNVWNSRGHDGVGPATENGLRQLTKWFTGNRIFVTVHCDPILRTIGFTLNGVSFPHAITNIQHDLSHCRPFLCFSSDAHATSL